MPRYFIILCLVFVFLSLAPSVYELSQKPHLQSNRSFELVHNYYTDYNFYLSRIREGLEGRVTVQEKYTSEKHQRSLIQIFYLSLGWAGRMVRIPPNQAHYPYHIARIVLGFTLLWVLSLCIASLWKQTLWRIIAFFVVVTASSWPDWQSSLARGHLVGYMQWWTVVDPLQRITFIPHLLASQLIILGITYVLCKRDTVLKANQWVFLGILGLALGFIFPPGLLFLYGILFFILVFRWIEHLSTKTNRDQFFYIIIGISILILISIPALVYYSLFLPLDPWKRLVVINLRPTGFTFREYVLAIGPVLPFGIFGILLALFRHERRMYGFISWTFAWLTALFVLTFLKRINPIRITEIAPQIPLGLFTVYGCYAVYTMLKNKRNMVFRIATTTIIVLIISIVTVGILMMYGSFKAQKAFITQKVQATHPLVHGNNIVMYPLTDFMGAIAYLETHADRSAIVLSELTAGNYIPVYSGNTVYIGQDNTVNAEEKKVKVVHFFRGEMSPHDAYVWLTKEGISYVFYGPQEREDGGGEDLKALYPFLEDQYRNTYVRIYRVR